MPTRFYYRLGQLTSSVFAGQSPPSSVTTTEMVCTKPFVYQLSEAPLPRILQSWAKRFKNLPPLLTTLPLS